jgi:hypothetical protein
MLASPITTQTVRGQASIWAVIQAVGLLLITLVGLGWAYYTTQIMHQPIQSRQPGKLIAALIGLLIQAVRSIMALNSSIRVDHDGLEYKRYFSSRRIEFDQVFELDCPQTSRVEGLKSGFQLLFVLNHHEVKVDLRPFTNHAKLLRAILDGVHQARPKAKISTTLEPHPPQSPVLLPPRPERLIVPNLDASDHIPPVVAPVIAPVIAPVNVQVSAELEQLADVLYSVGASTQAAHLARVIDGYRGGIVTRADLISEVRRLHGLTGPIASLRDRILEQLAREPLAVS